MAIVVQTVRTYALDGSTKDFIVPFEYLARKFVQVSLLGTAGRKQLVLNSEFRFSTKNQVTLLQAWGTANGYDRVELRRHTSSTERLVDFTDGSILRATDLNISQIQAIHIAEEARDAALLALPQDDDGNLDAKNRRIVNLAPGINAKDAVNKQQLDETLGEAGGVLSDIKDTQGEIYDYMEKFATDTAMVRGVSWVYNEGSAVGGESVIRIDKPTKVFAVPYLELNGSRQEIGYHFEFDIATQSITLAKPLEAGDFLMAMTTESSIPLEDMLSSANGASSIGTTSGKTVQQVLDTILPVVDSVASLGTVAPIDGKAVKTSGYYAGSTKGAGLYVYDSTKAGQNDAVTVINGWVRMFDIVRTASDAGITSGMESASATSRLNALLASAVDGCVFNLEDMTINLRSHAKIANVNNVTLTNFVFRGDKANWSFTASDRGILLANRCNGLEVCKGEIVGVRVSHPNAAMQDSISASGRIQDGDAGMEFKLCNDLYVHHNKVHGVKTWGILSTNGTRPTVSDNVVYDCARQSGISVSIGTNVDVTDAIITNNVVYNVGLYGIEIEKWTKRVYRTHVSNNNVYDAQYGINLVGLISGADVHHNDIRGCYYGIAGTTLNTSAASEAKLRNTFRENNLLSNYVGIGPSNSRYVSYINNQINGNRDSHWFIKNPYDAVEIVVDSTKFYSLRSLNSGTKIMVNGSVCTVQSSQEVTSGDIIEKIGLRKVYLVTVDALPAGVEDFTPFKTEVDAGTSYGYWAFYQPNHHEIVEGNVIMNVKYGFYQTAVTNENNGCVALRNTFINVSVPVAGATFGIAVYKSTLHGCTRYTDGQGKLNNNQVGLRGLPVVQQSTPVAGSANKPTINFHNYEEDIPVRFHLQAGNVSWGTSAGDINLAVVLNGTTMGYAKVSAKNSNVDAVIDNLNAGALPKGQNTLRVIDTSGSLSFDYWRVVIFVAD